MLLVLIVERNKMVWHLINKPQLEGGRYEGKLSDIKIFCRIAVAVGIAFFVFFFFFFFSFKNKWSHSLPLHFLLKYHSLCNKEMLRR